MLNLNGRLFGLCLLSCGVVACGAAGESTVTPPFETAEDIQVWATSASAVAVYSHAYQPIAVSDGADAYADPECPVTSDDGTTLRISGDCTDSAGRQWSGQASVVRDGDDRNLTLDDFNGNRGTLTLFATDRAVRQFEAHLVIGGVTTIDYAGSVVGGYQGQTLWNGSGRVKRRGVFPPNGSVDAATLDEVVDDAVCSGQPASGKTTLKAGDHTAVIAYDGGSDCDGEKRARLSVNGKDRGLIDGINCAVRPGGKANSAFAFVLLTAFWVRRKSGPSLG